VSGPGGRRSGQGDPAGLFDVTADGAVVVRVHAQPGSSRPGVAGVHGGALKVRVRPRAEGGRANRAIEAVLAEVFGVPASTVLVTTGTTGRAKRVRVSGVDATLAAERLRQALRATES
jgi:uncharacterized protein (TIGR00251 family)